ncbi:transcription factor [Ganoderma sinense ZZ0214-1]|uniref:Transcription factor n=1 Tax=Ganoderma sinense ZZ0214-1 TaxID=1077348 RepID=A0A2G8RTY1_9APHY|nr:transcription factor [Ganoderma sinense ZZ0214-1]
MSAPTDSKAHRAHLAATSNALSSNPPYSNPPNGRSAEEEKVSVAFVKGAKRKRLSKALQACDACHKSKRSNCYYASKTCTYTDAAGRPVPAPRNAHPERPDSVATAQPATETPPWAGQATLSSPPVNPQGVERDPTTKRSRKGQGAPDSSPPLSSKSDASSETFTYTSDPAITHELVNIFFAHCNPQRMIIHKPSFSADLTLSKIPPYLVLAVCAVAAPLSKAVASKASHPRLAGVPFFQQALSLMFDNSGRLLCEPTVSTAQALCLLEMHEIAASHSWTRHFRYFELALQVLEGSLEVQQPDNSTPPSPTDSSALMKFIDRECTRRCFWLILHMEWISYIYTHRDVRPRMAELADLVRLPIDETTFELASVTNSATCEYLRRPAPQTRYASQFGHVLRILEIYHKVENVLTNKEGPARAIAIAPLRKQLESWHASLPSHLQFNEENLETQVTMFETSSNSGAWSFCFMHAMYACCYLAVLEGEGTLSEPIPWIRDQLNMIFNTAVLTPAGLDPNSYSKYSPDDPQVHVWDRDFEKLWGFKVVVVAQQWRQSQAQAKQDKARTEEQHRQQQQQQQQQQQALYRETSSSKSSSNSPTSSHSSPTAVKLQSQPYEGRRDGNPRALLRTNISMPDLDARGGFVPRTSLPSLEQAGLLESLNAKGPFEGFASSLSLGSQNQSSRDSPPTTNGNGGGARGQPNTSPGSVVGSLPPNMNWLVDAGGGARP